MADRERRLVFRARRPQPQPPCRWLRAAYSPRHLRKPLFDWNPLTAYLYIAKSILENRRLSRRRNRFYIRDVFRASTITTGTPARPAL